MMRRLAALMDADFVGYSRLMGLDEAGTFQALKAHLKELITPAIAAHHGRVVKYVGDGALAEFASVVDAVSCAMEIQHTMLERNQNMAFDQRMELRIGVHLGDILVENDEIFGDGVAIAARLQEVAPPGGICLSEQVYDQVRAKLDLDRIDPERARLANVPRSIKAWHWLPDGSGGPATILLEDAPQVGHGRPSIAVLPFVNMSDIAGQEHVSDGFTEELIATLSRCRWLLVAARNSSFTYKGRAVDVRRVADELRVRYILEGSVRRSGNRIRITAQLLSGADGTLVWAERYDRTLDNVFDLQDEIAGEITGTIEPALGAIEFAALRGRAPLDMTAWEIYLEGLWHLYKFTVDDLQAARNLLERAIAIDPLFAQAFARLAYVHIQLGWYGPIEERSERLTDATRLAQQAIALDEKEPAAHMALGRSLALGGAPLSGMAHLRNALKLDPSFAQAHFALGQAFCYVEEPELGIAEINEALRLSPRDPHRWTFYNMLAMANYMSRRLDEAALAARAALREPNTTFWPAMVLVAILGRQGNVEAMPAAISELHGFRPGMTARSARREFYFGNVSPVSELFIDRFIEDLLKAGLPQ